MDKFTVFLFVAFLLQLSSQETEKKYKAVVTEILPSDDETNIKTYDRIITNCKYVYSQDIILFPETTLTMHKEWASLVPHPEEHVIPYKNETYKDYKAITTISKLAASVGSYVVVHLLERRNCIKGEDCPQRGYFLYNTNVAFDRKGMVVARYRKINEYNKDVDRAAGELSTFTTDFGVTFGLITGLDILFQTPSVDLIKAKGIKTILLSNRWEGELPFLTASQIQGGWSYATNATLLVSGTSDIFNGSSGTGVYFGRKSFYDFMNEWPGIMYFGWDMWKLPGQSPVSVKHEPSPVPAPGLRLHKDPTLSSAKAMNLEFERNELKETICHGEFCCKFDINWVEVMENSPEGYTYKAVVFKGDRSFGGYFTREVSYCAVVLCVNGDCTQKPSNNNYPLIFKKMNIQGEFPTKHNIQIPTTLRWDVRDGGVQVLNLMNYNSFRFHTEEIGEKTHATIELTTRYVKNIISFGIYNMKNN